jgi:hypothetical protein
VEFPSETPVKWSKMSKQEFIESTPGYPTRKLLRSLKKRGFILRRKDSSPYHPEPFGGTNRNRFKVKEIGNGKYRLNHGGHRYAACKILGINEIDVYVLEDK